MASRPPRATLALAAAAAYSDGTLDNVFGLSPMAIPASTGLVFYPHGDGAPDTTYTVYSDFRVMEDYVCKTIGEMRNYDCGIASLNVMD